MDFPACSGDVVGVSPGKTHRLKAIQELESNLVFAQNRCGELKDQVRLIRSFYQKRRENRGSDSNIEWEEEINSFNSSFSCENIGKNELEFLNGPKQPVKNEESLVQSLEFDKRLNTGPKEVVQIILSGMSQTVNCHAKEGKRTDSFMQTDPEIDTKSKPRRVKQTKNSNKKSTKMKESEERNKALAKELISLPFVKKSKNQKKNRRRHSSIEVCPLQKFSEIAIRDQDVDSSSILIRAGTKFCAPTSMSLTTLPFTPSQDLSPTENSVKEAKRYKSSTTSYLLPTVASSMKRAYRPLRSEYEGSRRIPFIVGKSLAKSHNLGTKIQETLSLIKRVGSFIPPAVGLSSDDLELRSMLSVRKTSSVAIKTNLALLSGYGPTSGKVVVKDKSLTLAKKSPGDTRNGKVESQQLKSVLMDLHDEFSLLTKKYDSLREHSQTPESDDQLTKLDNELNRKENEITVIMRLYNEVNELKTRLTALESLPSNRSYQNVSQTTIPSSRKNASSENVKLSQFLRRIDQFQDKLKNYTPFTPF